jgi:transposase-like protein
VAEPGTGRGVSDVFFDAIVVKVRENGHIAKRSIYVVLAINLEGKKELLGLLAGGE